MNAYTASALFLLLVLASPAAEPASASAKEKEKELRELRGRITALQNQLAASEESKSEAVDTLRESERAISEANRELRELGGRSREHSRRLSELNAESRQRERALKAQQALLADALYRRYLGGQAEPLKLLLNREDPNQIARHLYYFGAISRRAPN